MRSAAPDSGLGPSLPWYSQAGLSPPWRQALTPATWPHLAYPQPAPSSQPVIVGLLSPHLPCRDGYLSGVQALARSLQAVGSRHPLLVIYTADTLSSAAVTALEAETGCKPLAVERYRPPGRAWDREEGQGRASGAHCALPC